LSGLECVRIGRSINSPHFGVEELNLSSVTVFRRRRTISFVDDIGDFQRSGKL